MIKNFEICNFREWILGYNKDIQNIVPLGKLNFKKEIFKNKQPHDSNEPQGCLFIRELKTKILISSGKQNSLFRGIASQHTFSIFEFIVNWDTSDRCLSQFFNFNLSFRRTIPMS